MSDATAIRLGGTAFNELLAVAGLVAIVIAVGIFAIQMAISAVRRDPSGIGRAAGGLVVMGLGGGAAIAVTELLLQAVDAISAGVLQVTTGDSMQQMGNSILAAGSISASTSNPAALILISLLALAAVVMVWLALTVRKLLVIVAAVLSPFAFAGSLADFSRSWVRRWVELIVALVFSKLILMFVFVIGIFVLLKGLGSTSTGGTQEITQTVSGVLILALAGFAPGGHQDGPLRRSPPRGNARDGLARDGRRRRGPVDGPPRQCRGDARRYGGRGGRGRRVEHEALVATDTRQHVPRFGVSVGGRKRRPVHPR